MAQNLALVAHGPIFIGTVINLMLYGMLITQVHLYITTYKKSVCALPAVPFVPIDVDDDDFRSDRWWMKAIITFIFVADTMNTVFDIQYLYDSLINHYSAQSLVSPRDVLLNPSQTTLHSSKKQIGFLQQVIIIFLVTRFYAEPCITGNIGDRRSSVDVAGIATSIAIGVVPEWTEFQKFKIPVIIWLTVSALVDTSITLVLTWHLRKHKGSFKGSNDILDRIVRLTVQTGLITSVWAIVDLGVFLVKWPIHSHLAFNFPLAKLYSNSLLSSLNSRAGWKYSSSRDDEQKTTLGRRPDVLTLGASRVRPEVYIDVESHEMGSLDPDTKVARDDDFARSTTQSQSKHVSASDLTPPV
ncbi:hypothetical protein EW146_g6164 [Bondarzewia mesenterica]|uniref:DUF6534 domain-containing protein n=1 Tax=Bondarzewia mesenterica TaxID=1095465 RepID=A0A4S4LQE5_9AGAM|nr:hypothetical protein EW146_g6164 [Bondarzewia mesenterica]